MITPHTFLKIGSFLPSAILVSVAMMFAGLYEWVNAAWVLDEVQAPPPRDKVTAKNAKEQPKWIRRRRPVLPALGIIVGTHVLGLLLFSVITTPFFSKNKTVRLIHMIQCTIHNFRYSMLGARSSTAVHYVNSSLTGSSGASVVPITPYCSSLVPFEIPQPLLCLNSDIRNISSELFTSGNTSHSPWPSADGCFSFLLHFTNTRYTLCQVFGIRRAWFGVDSVGAGGDC